MHLPSHAPIWKLDWGLSVQLAHQTPAEGSAGRTDVKGATSEWLTEASTALQGPYADNMESVSISCSVSLTGAIRATADVEAVVKGFCEWLHQHMAYSAPCC